MRIVHVDKQRGWTGQTKQVFLQVRGLRDRGHDVAVVCQPTSKLGENAEAVGVPVQRFRIQGMRLYIAALKTARFLRTWRADVIHCHGGRDHVLAVLAGWLAGVKVIRTKHNHTALKRSFHYRKYTDRLTAVSGSSLQTLLDAGLDPDKLDTVYDGVEVDVYKPGPRDPEVLEEFGLAEDDLVIGMMGRLTSGRKDAPTFLRAAAEVLKAAPRAKFMLIGMTAPEIETQARELGLGDRAIFTDIRTDVPRLLRALSIYVQPSLHEALGASIVEAMATGLPVVASRVGGIPEVVVEGETGLLNEPQKPEAFARNILELVNNPDRAAAMGRRGRERIVNHFSIEHMAEELETVYKKALGKA